jgi:hypothetical protein
MTRAVGRAGGRRPWELSNFAGYDWQEDVEADDFETEEAAERKKTHLS